MPKPRNRKRPGLPFRDRLKRLAERARAEAQDLPPGRERNRLVKNALENDTAAEIDLWLSSPGLQSPKQPLG